MKQIRIGLAFSAWLAFGFSSQADTIIDPPADLGELATLEIETADDCLGGIWLMASILETIFPHSAVLIPNAKKRAITVKNFVLDNPLEMMKGHLGDLGTVTGHIWVLDPNFEEESETDLSLHQYSFTCTADDGFTFDKYTTSYEGSIKPFDERNGFVRYAAITFIRPGAIVPRESVASVLKKKWWVKTWMGLKPKVSSKHLRTVRLQFKESITKVPRFVWTLEGSVEATTISSILPIPPPVLPVIDTHVE